MLTKSVAIVLPALLLLRAWAFAERLQWRRHVPLWLTAAAYVAWLLQVGFLAPSLQGAPRPVLLHWLTQLKAGVYYLWLAIMPVRPVLIAVRRLI